MGISRNLDFFGELWKLLRHLKEFKMFLLKIVAREVTNFRVDLSNSNEQNFSGFISKLLLLMDLNSPFGSNSTKVFPNACRLGTFYFTYYKNFSHRYVETKLFLFMALNSPFGSKSSFENAVTKQLISKVMNEVD